MRMLAAPVALCSGFPYACRACVRCCQGGRCALHSLPGQAAGITTSAAAGAVPNVHGDTSGNGLDAYGKAAGQISIGRRVVVVAKELLCLGVFRKAGWDVVPHNKGTHALMTWQ